MKKILLSVSVASLFLMSGCMKDLDGCDHDKGKCHHHSKCHHHDCHHQNQQPQPTQPVTPPSTGTSQPPVNPITI